MSQDGYQESLQNIPAPGDFCLLCGATPAVTAVFIPGNPEQYGGKKGKIRFIRYCLCQQCQSDPKTPEKVEKVINAEFLGGALYDLS